MSSALAVLQYQFVSALILVMVLGVCSRKLPLVISSAV